MQTVEQALADLVHKGLVRKDDAFTRAPDAATLEKLLQLQGANLAAESRPAPTTAFGTRTIS